jgi:hypothetical protein
MATIIRLINYRHYFENGTDYIEIAHSDKKKVFVAIILGDELKAVKEGDELVDVDDVILKMAEHVKKSRKREKSKK